MMKTHRARILLLAAFAAAIFFLLIEKNILPGIPQRSTNHRGFEILATVLRYIRTDYVEEPNPQKTMDGAFQGLINSLDILSGYLDRETAAKYAYPRKLQFKDVGLVLLKRAGSFPLITGLVEKSPAAQAGIAVGEYLSAVDDRPTFLGSLAEINLDLKSLEPTPVKLRIIQDSSTKEMKVERGDIYPKALSLEPQKDTSGIVKVAHFYPPLAEEFRKSIVPRLVGQKLPLVLDFRNCHEGGLEEARAFLNIFLQAEKIGYFEKKSGAKEFLSCPERAPLDKLPLIIWVNPATMGPAEVVAGVLRDFQRARVVGLPTLGLVAEQSLFSLESGDALLLSTGVFCFNSGEKLWGKGVMVDAELDPEKTETQDYLSRTLLLLAGR
jgi:carboxyl-terminal processing protease